MNDEKSGCETMSHDKSAIVTGASRGIGRGIAEELARRGYALTIAGRNEADLEATAEVLRKVGAPFVSAVVLDLAAAGCGSTLMDAHVAERQGLDVVILSGGMASAGAVESMPLRRAERLMQVNFLSAFEVVQCALPILRATAEARGVPSRIIGIGSSTGFFPKADLSAYGASKAALALLLDAVNLEESPRGVLATTVAPGYVATTMSDWLTDSIPADEMLQVDDVVRAVSMVLDLGRAAVLPRMLMMRSGTTGYEP